MGTTLIPGWHLLRDLMAWRTRPTRLPTGFSEMPAPAFPPITAEREAATVTTTLNTIGRAMRGESVGTPEVPEDKPFPLGSGPHGHRERMRDRLLDRGPDSLADYELLEMLLFLCQPKGDTKPRAKALMNQFGSFAAVIAAPKDYLLASPGLGRYSVATIKLVQAAALRLARADLADRPLLSNWDRLTDYLTAVMSREQTEQFRVLFLDTRNRLIADEVQGRGTVNHTPAYPREVVRRALELHASAIIIAHNHPSGNPKPSADDIEMTQCVREAAEALGIVLHDHVIVGQGSTTSFRRAGLLR